VSIGGTEDPVQLVFDSQTGPAVTAAVMAMGNRFRMIVTQVDVVPIDEPLPKLRVARAIWVAQARHQDGCHSLDPRRQGAAYGLQPRPDR